MAPWIVRRGTEEASHLLMDGGSLFVATQDIPLFHEAFAKSVLRNELNYICERKSNERMRLFVDFDIYAPLAYTTDQITKLLSIASGVGRDFFSDSEKCLDILVLASEPREDIRDGTKCIKTGIHLVWESLTVEVRTASIFRDALVQKYELSALDVPLGGWAKAVDAAVTKHGILRTLYSHKLGNCPTCNNKKAQSKSCTVCMTKGKVDINVPYFLKAMWIQTTNKLENIPTAKTVAAIADHLTRASIRTDDVVISHNAALPAWFENSMFLPSTLTEPGNASLSKEQRLNRAELLTEGQDVFENILQKEPIHAELRNKIELYIRRISRQELLNLAYRDVRITSAFYAMDREFIFAKSDSSYCMNTRNEHRSNTVYFELKRGSGECRQKCFCRCATIVGRRSGLCSKFQSHPVIIVHKDLKVFFPPVAEAPAEASPLPSPVDQTQPAAEPRGVCTTLLVNKSARKHRLGSVLAEAEKELDAKVAKM